MLAPPPLLASLGKASANTFYMHMTVRSVILYVAFTLTLTLFLVADGSDVQHEGADVTRDRRSGPFGGVESDEDDKSAGIAIWPYSAC
jgi:Na+/H+ antiporter NhaD/arsenite permease-like protein